jgi:DNA polymerase I-like protein with 3'-5' exonuclease and polymerase domains
VLLEADYSLAELRVGSHYAQEKTMQEKLNRGADLHGETAEEAGVPRDEGKRITFSAFYGIGKKTLAERLRIPEKLAGDRLRRWHRLYPGVRIAVQQGPSDGGSSWLHPDVHWPDAALQHATDRNAQS